MSPDLSDARERVVQQLSAHFAADHVTVDGLEERLDRAYKATSESELMALVSDLPALDRADLPVVARGYQVARMGDAPKRKTVWALMAGVERRGVWTLPRRLLSLACMGYVWVDMREALFPPGGIDIDAYVMWGAIGIIVPPGVRVECDGLAIMGGFEQTITSHQDDYNPDAPVVRVRGLALMGGVEVQVAKPGELPEDRKNLPPA